MMRHAFMRAGARWIAAVFSVWTASCGHGHIGEYTPKSSRLQAAGRTEAGGRRRPTTVGRCSSSRAVRSWTR